MINWKIAVENILPWIDDEMKKNGCERKFSSRGRYKKSIVLLITVVMDKMGITLEDKDKKRFNINSFIYSFQKNIMRRGYEVKLYGENGVFLDESSTMAIIQDIPIIESETKSDSIYSVGSTEPDWEGYKNLYDKRVEREDNVRKMRHGKDKKTLSDYKEKIDDVLSSIKDGIDKSESGLYVMIMGDVRKFLGLEFEIFGNYTIFSNIRTVMEDFNIIVKEKGYCEKRRIYQYITFRYKEKYEQFVWEREGFVSRKEYEECLKEDRKCRRIKKVVDECRNKDPNSLFNNKELVKKIFTECDIDKEK